MPGRGARLFEVQILRLIDKKLIDLKPHQGDGLPRFEAGDQSRLHLRVALKEVVESGGESVAKLARTRVRIFILGHRELCNLERAIQQVRSESLFTVHFRGTPDRLDVVVLNLPEVIFGLRISVAEDATRIGWTIDMRYAVTSAIDRDRTRELLDPRIRCFDTGHAQQHGRCDTYQQ